MQDQEIHCRFRNHTAYPRFHQLRDLRFSSLCTSYFTTITSNHNTISTAQKPIRHENPSPNIHRLTIASPERKTPTPEQIKGRRNTITAKSHGSPARPVFLETVQHSSTSRRGSSTNTPKVSLALLPSFLPPPPSPPFSSHPLPLFPPLLCHQANFSFLQKTRILAHSYRTKKPRLALTHLSNLLDPSLRPNRHFCCSSFGACQDWGIEKDTYRW